MAIVAKEMRNGMKLLRESVTVGVIWLGQGFEQVDKGIPSPFRTLKVGFRQHVVVPNQAEPSATRARRS